MVGSESLVLLASFLAICLLVYGVMVFFGHRQAIQDRFRKPQAPKVSVLKREDPTRTLKNQALQYLSYLGKWTIRDPVSLAPLRTQLIHGGFRHPGAPVVFFGLRALTAIILPLPYLFYGFFKGIKVSANLSVALLLAGIGYYLPTYLLKFSTRRRQDRMDRALPDVLDLMIISIEAGLSLQATMNKVSEEIKPVSQELHEELQITNAELRTGVSRERALNNLAERTGVNSIKSLVALMVQSERMGASISQALRTHADFVRVQRAQRAEELAAKLPIKIIFPTLVCIFPSLFIVILGPAAIQIYKTLLTK
ncbi:MAG: type II secretion system F family protein [Deltaproteobacteria bacterium]|nr:type II secretion system F family protein [Deltaproteobacteria bacterium]